MISKEELIRQYREKQQQITTHKEQLLYLKQQKSEKESAIALLNKKNKAIIENEVPAALKLAQINASPSVDLNKEDKQAVLRYLQEQETALRKVEEHNKELFEKTKKLSALLQNVGEHLAVGYDRNKLAELVNHSGITSTKNPKNIGFDLLLELLEEEKSKYTWTLDSTDKRNLLSAVSHKEESIQFILGVDEQTQREISSALEELEQLKLKLVRNFDERNSSAEAVVLLTQQIIQKETVTIKELADEEEELDRQIKIIEKQEEETKQQRESEEREKAEQRAILAEKLAGMLELYIDDRNKHYHTKDLFISEDRDIRDQFIKEIGNAENGLLKAYVESGNSEVVLKKITAEVDKFPGAKMQATLSKIVVTLIEADAKPEVVENLSQKAEQVLLAFETKDGRHREYALKIRSLYGTIDGIKTYAKDLSEHEKEIMNQLSEDLKKDLDLFTYQNQEKIPGKETYQKFEMKFKAKLHSQDDVMSEYSSWPEVVFNILLSLATIGKLIYSKVTTGRASFWFDKIEDQKEAELPVDEALKDIGNFLSA
ncbi:MULTISPECIES: hypothetical protein [Legionella]|uniref:Ankyrin repeat protein n=1 Tax=Legionella resiliens TaxID=2905958 RepID=A0ABS8WZY6_9GAMM|nr:MULTISPECIES: hypothetical protein [unclassified Legionella]MCE0722138.1 hypothetical protein [Legionella sp. 9fVS26]MCE3531292.1 hypothetical protein [Legionella sp. 8cVS16]QLZ67304.1 hypothetical protein FOLKNPGA_00069 [Legionella sp. PC1000]